MLDKDIYNNSVTELSTFFTKKTSKTIVDSIYEFCSNYAEQNDIEVLVESIFQTKIDEFKDVFLNNKLLVKDIINNKISINNICYLRQEELSPDRYTNIINKKKLEEHKKNNKATSDAFTCSKCKSKKSVISERQTRSGDEPATIFVTCVECSYCFKM